MPAMLPIFALELLLLLLLLAPNVAMASHVRCSWQVGPGSPSRYGYRHFCLANTADQTATSAHYKCQLGTAEPSVRVADWGESGAEKLEWHSPCGEDGGYGKVEGRCVSSHWALCLGASVKGQCYYMAAADDCEWPDLISSKDLPNSLQVWYHFD